MSYLMKFTHKICFCGHGISPGQSGVDLELEPGLLLSENSVTHDGLW